MGLVRDVLRAAKQRDSKVFGHAPFTPVIPGDYKRAIAAGLVLGDPGSIGLAPLIGDKAGGYFLTWATGPIKSCVVYFGPEGQKFVAAASEAEFIAMMPYGTGLSDGMAYWFNKLTESADTEVPTELDPATLAAHRASGEPTDAWIGNMVAAVEAAGLAVDPDPLARIEAVNRAVLAHWLAVCERRFETPLVSADLAMEVRAYKASEGFQVGERIAHPIFGEGVVEARPDPGKMTVFFKSGRKILAQAKDIPIPPVTKKRRR